MSISPLMLNFTSGLVQNSGLTVNTDMTDQQTTYAGYLGSDTYQDVLTDADGVLAAGTITSLKALSTDEFYPVFDQPPTTSTYESQDALITSHTGDIITADYGVFVSIFGSANGYKATTNEFISANADAEKFNQGFQAGDMDKLTTGGWSSVSTDLNTLGSDLAATGKLFRFSSYSRIGYPSELLISIKVAGRGYVGFEEQLTAQGFTNLQIKAIKEGGKAPSVLEEKALYRAMQNVKNAQLTEILEILGFTHTGIETLADLLDLTKTLPNSYSSLQTTVGADTVNLFVNGAVNGLVSYANDPRITATTDELAWANIAFGRTLTEVKGIKDLVVSDSATVLQNIEVNSDLGEVAALDSPTTSAASTYFGTTLAQGSGANGTFTLGDFIGSIAGLNITDNLTTVNELMATLDLTDVNDVFTAMRETIAGDYGTAPVTIPSGPGAGSYTDQDDAFTGSGGLIDAFNTAYTTLLTGVDTADAVTAWTAIYTQITDEQSNLTTAGVTLGSVTAAPTPAVMAWGQGIGSFAEDNTVGGAGWIVERIADTSNVTGQSLIGALREQRNAKNLQNLGMKTDNLG